MTNPLAALATSVMNSTLDDFGQLKASCKELLDSRQVAHEALIDMDAKLRKFLGLLDQARFHVRWLSGEDSLFTFSEAAEILCVAPDKAREAVLAGVPYDLHRLAAGGVNYTCPVCLAEH